MSQCESEKLDLTPLDKIIDQYAASKGALIPILQRAQEIYGYLPCKILKRIAERTCTPLNEINGVVTFYAQFYLERPGKYIIRQCDGTACHIRGASKIMDTVERELGIKVGETTPGHKYTYEVVYCLGSCGLAPVAVINDKFYGRLEPSEFVLALKGLK